MYKKYGLASDSAVEYGDNVHQRYRLVKLSEIIVLRVKMGGKTLTQLPLQGTIRDVVQSPEKVAGGGEEGGEGRDGGGGGGMTEVKESTDSTEPMEVSNWERVVDLFYKVFR